MAKKSTFFMLFVIAILSTTLAQAQSTIPYYHQQADFLFTSPGALGNGLLGYVNPALLNYLYGPEMRFVFSTDKGQLSSVERWGLFTGVPHLGFGMIRQDGINDYRIGFGGGSEAYSFGLGYGWSGGDLEDVDRDKLLTLGTLVRPIRFLSIGLCGNFALHSNNREGIFDLAIRPLGSDLITLFGDFSLQTKERFDDAKWSAGVVIQALPGIHLTGRYFESKAITAGLTFSFGNNGLATQVNLPEGKELDQIYYGVRVGAKEHNIFDPLFMRNKKYLSMDLKGKVGYLKYRFFDEDKHTLTEVLTDLRGVIKDPTVAGVVINLSGMYISRELVWEIREKLKQVRQAGKRVIVYLDRGGMTEYHLASVADKLILDPEGMLVLEGYIMGRTFLKGTLEKLGIGYDEWRFFKYKSAAEVLSRDKMSDADREQRQALIDDIYDVVRGDICQSRNFSVHKFDELINEKVIFLPNEALKEGLVDTLARWVEIDKIVKSFEGKKKCMIKSNSLAQNVLPRREWGAKPKIAVVYALGICDMDQGINARKLEKVFEGLTKNNSIKAVVLRADSPGGDGLASDLVAEAMKKCAEKKPVIVTQGNVAASGGYWISMYADTIVAAPYTITGSIGVIGGWLWNKEFGDKLGMISDHVKVGKHADIGFGIRLPLLGIQIPDRNLTVDERTKVETMIKDFYKAFVGKVANGRKMTTQSVEEIAQGRVWSGIDGKEKGLVDVIGGLETAIILAKEAADIPADKEVDIVELPKLGWFNPQMFELQLFGYKAQKPIQSYEIEYLKTIAKFPGQPLPLLSPDLCPVEK